jgi:hypothetical protein
LTAQPENEEIEMNEQTGQHWSETNAGATALAIAFLASLPVPWLIVGNVQPLWGAVLACFGWAAAVNAAFLFIQWRTDPSNEKGHMVPISVLIWAVISLTTINGLTF